MKIRHQHLVVRIERSRREQQIVDVVDSHWREHGFGPTLREIMAALAMSSTSMVCAAIAELKERGVLASEPRLSRTLRVVRDHSE